MAMTIGGESMTAPLQADPAESKRYKKEFYIMCIAFGLNHATVTTPIQFATSVLTAQNGNASNAALYGSTLLSSLFLSNLLYAILGAKKGLSLSMLAYAVYVAFFAFASSMCKDKDPKGGCIEADDLQLPIACLGGLIGGLGAGLLWTCQGAFYALVCEKLATAEARPKAEITAEYAGNFAIIFLGFECAIRAATTFVTGGEFLHLSFEVAFYIWSAAAFLATIFFWTCSTNLQPAVEVARGSVFDKLLAAVHLWNDPKLWLLQFTNVTFGFGAAWLAGYVNPNILKPALNATFIGFAGAGLSGLAAILSPILGKLAANIGKGPIITLGAAAFLCLGIFSKFVGNPATWGYGATIFYAFMGIGRAVYESTNKAVIADFFPGEKSPGAFANAFVFGTSSSLAVFLLSTFHYPEPEVYLLILFAVLTLPGFLLAGFLTPRESKGAIV